MFNIALSEYSGHRITLSERSGYRITLTQANYTEFDGYLIDENRDIVEDENGNPINVL